MSLDVYLDKVVYEGNVTHNLNIMAKEAGIYEYLWRPDELDLWCAEELIEPLTEGLRKLKADPEHFKKFNSENGWGNYDWLVDFVHKYLQACIMFPDARIRVSR